MERHHWMRRCGGEMLRPWKMTITESGHFRNEFRQRSQSDDGPASLQAGQQASMLRGRLRIVLARSTVAVVVQKA